MLQILFQSIPSILFEPIAVGAVLGLAVAAVLCWKKKSVWYWSVAFTLLFMLGWRLAIQIISSRYASILIFPAIIATAYFAVRTESLASYIPKFPVSLRKWLPYLTVIGIAVGGLVQFLYYNPYADRIIKVVELIKEDSLQFKNYHVLAVEKSRLEYYAQKPTSAIFYYGTEDYPLFIGRATKNSFPQNVEVVYVVIAVSSKIPIDYYFQEVPNDIRKRLVLLGEFPHNRKKRRITKVYRFRNLQKAAMFPAKDDAEPGGPAFLYQITFDKGKIASDAFYKNQIGFFQKNKLQFPVLKDFPAQWRIAGIGGYSHNSHGELGLVSMEGKTAFRLKSNTLISTMYAVPFPAEKYFVKVRLTGKKGSLFSIGAHCYTAGKWIAEEALPYQEIPSTGKWDMIFYPQFLSPKATTVNLVLRLYHGEIFVHSIELYEAEEDK